jgi:hypothetical protein
MKKLLALFILIFLSSCAASFPEYITVTSATYYAVGNTWAFRNPDIPPYATIPPNYRVSVVGYTGIWWVVQSERGKFLIPWNALAQDDGSPHTFTTNYIYPQNYQPMPSYDGGRGNGYSGGASHATEIGPRGGEYYINGNGNKTYVTPQSTYDQQPVQTGPRGGQYYYNSNGRKTYIKH